MKTIFFALTIFLAVAEIGVAQNVNWKNSPADRPNRMEMNLGYDYAAAASLAYSRAFTLGLPVVAGARISLPMGNQVFDDFAIHMGAQVEVFEWRGFSLAANIGSNFRRFQNGMVRIVGFGADLAAIAGYYTPSWYAAAEFGFDKAVTTHLRHADAMKEFGFPAVRDGWYVPTGGNFHYGIQAGLTLSRLADLSLRLGATDAQFDDVDAALPYYLQLGVGVKF